MAVDRTSRYAGLPEIALPAGDGTTRTMSAPRVVPEPPTQGSYEVGAADRLDVLGQAATGDTTRWWVVADANPWADATRLERPGQSIRLPNG